MRISLSMNRDGIDARREQARVLERDVIASRDGDWEAKERLSKAFMPLLITLAKKRSDDNAKINRYIEAGRKGLFMAAKKYKPSVGIDRFQIFSLDFIEEQMNRVDKGGGFFSRLFGGG